jgi:hypothetical protein
VTSSVSHPIRWAGSPPHASRCHRWGPQGLRGLRPAAGHPGAGPLGAAGPHARGARPLGRCAPGSPCIVLHIGRRHHSCPHTVSGRPSLVRGHVRMLAPDRLATHRTPTAPHPNTGSPAVGGVQRSRSHRPRQRPPPSGAPTREAGVNGHLHVHRWLSARLGRRGRPVAAGPRAGIPSGALRLGLPRACGTEGGLPLPTTCESVFKKVPVEQGGEPSDESWPPGSSLHWSGSNIRNLWTDGGSG